MGYITEQELDQNLINKINNSDNIDKMIESAKKSINDELKPIKTDIDSLKPIKKEIDNLKSRVDNGKNDLYSAIIDKKVTPKSKDFNALVQGVKDIKQTNVQMSDEEILKKVKEKNKFYVKGDFIDTKFKIKSTKLSNWDNGEDCYRIVKSGIVYRCKKFYENNYSLPKANCTVKCNFQGNYIKFVEDDIIFFCETYGYSINNNTVTIYDHDLNIIKKGNSNEIFNKNSEFEVIAMTENFDIIIQYIIHPSNLSSYMDKNYIFKKYKMIDINGNEIWVQSGRIDISCKDYKYPIYFVNDWKTGKLYYNFQSIDKKPLQVTRENILNDERYTSSKSINISLDIYNNDFYKIITNTPPNTISEFEKTIFKNEKPFYDKQTTSDHNRYSRILYINEKIYYWYDSNIYLDDNTDKLYLISNNFNIGNVLYYNHLGFITYKYLEYSKSYEIYYSTFGYVLDNNTIIQLPQGNAQPSDTLENKTFTNDSGVLQTGNIKNYGDKIITPSNEIQTLNKGFYNNIKINPITPELIKNNVSTDDIIKIAKQKSNNIYQTGDFVNVEFKTNVKKITSYESDYYFKYYFVKNGIVISNNKNTTKYYFKDNIVERKIDVPNVKFIHRNMAYAIQDNTITVYDSDLNVIKKGVKNNIFDRCIGFNNLYQALIKKPIEMGHGYGDGNYYHLVITDINGSELYESSNYIENPGYASSFINNYNTGELYFCFKANKKYKVENRIVFENEYDTDKYNTYSHEFINNDLFTVLDIWGSRQNNFKAYRNGNPYYEDFFKYDCPYIFYKNSNIYVYVNDILYKDTGSQLNKIDSLGVDHNDIKLYDNEGLIYTKDNNVYYLDFGYKIKE